LANPIISGYTGLFNSIITDPADTFGVSLYALADENMNELALIILSSDFYTDAYRIIIGTSIPNIKVFIPYLNETNLTDFQNLIINASAIKPNISWMYPILPLGGSSNFNSKHRLLTFYQNTFNSNLFINYYPSGDSNYYDIFIREPNNSRYFCQYITQEKLNLLYDDISINEIHVPYSTSLEGSLDYQSISELDSKYSSKLYAHSFSTTQEYYLAVINGANLVPFSFSQLDVSGVLSRDYQDYEKAQAETNMKVLLPYVTANVSSNIGVINTKLSALTTPSIIEVSSDYTLLLTDAGKVIKVTAESIITVPLNSNAAIPIGSEIVILAFTENDVSIAFEDGVIIHSKEDLLVIDGQYSGVTLKKLGANEWVLIGALTA